MLADRGQFVPPSRPFSGHCYADQPLPIGHGATISAPSMHAMCTEALYPWLTRPGAKALDVGSGSGILLAIFGHIAARSAPSGCVVGVEHIPELVQAAASSLARQPETLQLVNSKVIQNFLGDARFGPPAEAAGLYTCIHVGAAAPFVPVGLINALAPGGRIVMPVGLVGGQELLAIDKDADGALTRSTLCRVQYVPLTSRAEQDSATHSPDPSG